VCICRYGIGQIYLRQEKYADALHHFQLALRLKPQGSILHHCCGTALARLGRAQEALAAYSAAVTADPKNGVARFDRAQQLLEEGRVQEALTDALALQVGADRGDGHGFGWVWRSGEDNGFLLLQMGPSRVGAVRGMCFCVCGCVLAATAVLLAVGFMLVTSSANP
jgi:Flp pilus assembly protein TadD